VDNVVSEVRQALKLFPQAKEFFFDDDTFNIRKDRVLELSRSSSRWDSAGPARHATIATTKR